MFAWPNLELTDEERTKYRHYGTKTHAGVLNRIYKVQLNSQADPDKGLPTIRLSGSVQISRRSRVYGVTFTGMTDRWRLQITNIAGTNFTAKGNRDNLDPIVSSLLPGTPYNGADLGSLTSPLTGSGTSDAYGPGFQLNPTYLFVIHPYPLLIEPNWLLMPNETLLFNGTPINVTLGDGAEPPEVVYTPNLILNIGIFVWEFPRELELSSKGK